MAPSPSSTPPNQIYQYSLLNALMSGVCTEGIPAARLLTHGDQGLGTFRDMNGELVLVDSQIYHFHANGTVSRATPHDAIPFAMVTRFVPQHCLRAQTLRDKQSLNRILDGVIPKTDNSFVSYRLHGRWRDMHVRMIRGRQYTGQKLSELHASQVEYTYHDVAGTVVGFRAPRSWQGVTVDAAV
ncbi:Origin recognition complex, subunit 1 [Ascosphaera pollenicola]|nr:Origin recognition complex, subunit 1 [Ascosphaera pollenicola]